jgi:uncharacterized repeat protein (TIGR03803 family)
MALASPAPDLSGSNGHYTLTGIAADITAELDALSFTPPVNGVPNTQVTTHFTLFDQGGATPDVLASFDYTDDGGFPHSSLIVDAAGDLFGATSQGGPGGAGTVFEIVNTGSVSAPVYSGTPTTLASFTGSDQPMAGLVRDAAGDLFGTRSFFDNTGSVFELVNTGSVNAPTYSSVPTTLVSFNGTDGGAPAGGLIVDAAGNLFGTTEFGGPGDRGTVFEIANTGTVSAPVYSSTPTTLWFFTGGADGRSPAGSLISDAAGDLFGTTSGDLSRTSTVFEIANTGTVSAPVYGTLTTLAAFGGEALAGLMRDAAGDLIGTTLIGGAGGGLGTVFELVNIGTVSAPSYGSTPATLVSFTGGDDGGEPFGGLVSDAAGDLFGTTSTGGPGGLGTVFEIVNTGTVSAPVYSHTPTTLWSFTGGADGADPHGSLTIDAAGDLFGTASEGGVSGTGVNAGTVFELVRTGSVYTFLSAIDTTTSVIDSDPAVVPTITGTVAGQTTTSEAAVTPFSHVTISDANNGGTETDTLSITLSGSGTLSGAGLSGSNGSYTLTGTAAAITTELDALSFAPVNGVPNASATTTFTLSDTSTAGTTSASDSVTTVIVETPLKPFTQVTLIDPNITDPGNGGIDTLSIIFSGGGTLTDGADFAGARTLSGSNGSYTLTGTAADINAELDALSFTGVPSPSFTLSDRFIDAVTVSFNGADGFDPKAGLISDAAGNLFGTTTSGNPGGTVFELANIGTVSAPIYSSTPTTLASFTGIDQPQAGLILDAAGDLLGTTTNSSGPGTVFEIANTGTVSAPVYSSAPTTLATFALRGPSGAFPQGGLIGDAAGNLFGTTTGVSLGGGGATRFGSLFEIANTGSVNAPVYGILTTLVTFNRTDGANPTANLIGDAAGDLFGTTSGGGANGLGTVFELVNTGTVSLPVYSSTPTTLWSFAGAGVGDGADPVAGLVRDAAGHLFGTTKAGGTWNYGTVFEIVNGTLTTLVSFNGTNPSLGNPILPEAGLIVDAAGDLFGTTEAGGANDFGTVFELVNSGTVSAPNYTNFGRGPITLWSFTSGADGADPLAGLTVDAAGDLFGTTSAGGPSGGGAGFELVKTDSGYTMAPSFTGTHAGQTTVSEAPVKPFSGVTISDPNSGGTGTDTLSIMVSGDGTLTDGAGFAGTSTLSGSNGHYTLTGTAADITAELDALSFTPVNGVPNTQVTTHFTLFDQGGATPKVLASFDDTNDGGFPLASLIVDAAGDLFGTTQQGGPGGAGTVFEIVNTGTVSAPVYSGTPTTLASFTGSDQPVAGLVRDAAGDLFGTRAFFDNTGSVFEIVNTGSVSAPVYSSTPTTMVSFNGTDGGYPAAGLILDAAGNLFGTTEFGGPGDHGTVFEIANTGSVSAPVYSSTPTTLWFFTGGADGDEPRGNLISDAAGDLFGTASDFNTLNDGTVFELVNTGSVSAPTYSALTTLVSFNGDDGADPLAGLIRDAAGDLFGTTLSGGPGGGLGTVFELVNTGTVSAPSYGSTPATLVTFTGGDDGGLPLGGVVGDAAGDLFGTTNNGGARGDGTVFEIVNTGTVSAPVYSHTPRTLWFFTGGADGKNPEAGLTIDAAGDLFGTASEGGVTGAGTVFELVKTGSVYTFLSAIDTTTSVIDSDPAVAPTIAGTVAGQTTVSEAPVTPFSHVTITDLNNGGTDTDTLSITFSGGGTLSGTGLTGSSGSYTLTGTAAAITAELDALSFTPVNGVPNTLATTTFTLSDTSSAGTTSASDSVTTVIDHDPAVAPTITGTVAGQTTVSEAPVTPFAHVTITDANNGGTDADTLSIVFSGGGALTDGAGFAGTSSLSGSNGSYTLTGTAADITAELDALSFTPPVNGVPNTSVTTTFTLSDSSSAGTTSASNSVTSVIDHDPAVAPTITGTVAGQTTVSETPVTPFSHVTIADANNGGTDTDTLSITLSGGGTLAGTGLSGSNGSYTLTGTAAAITAELDALSFTPVNGVPNTQVITTFTLSDTSGAGTASAGNSVTTVIDHDPAAAPTITGTLAGQTTVSEAPVTPFSHVTIADANNGGTDTDTLSITFSGGGTLAGTGLSGSNGSYTLTGTAAAITAELDALSFTPVNGVPSTSVTTTFTLSDTSTAGTTSTGNSVTTVIDHDPAVVNSVTASTAGNISDLDAAEIVTITVDFSGPVVVTGTPELQLNDSEVAAYSGGTGTSALTFSYTVQPGDNIADLQVQGLLLNGGTIKDGAGSNASVANAVADLHLQIDTTAPSPPPTLVLTHDTGVSNSDKITSDPSIIYSTPAAGDTLLYKVDSGSFSTAVPVFATDHTADGVHTVSVEEVDPAGNIGTASSLTFTLETIAAPPALALLHDTGVSNSDHITSDPTIIYMLSAAGDTLFYSVDSGSYSTLAPTTFPTDHSADGAHTVAIEEVDAAGNTSTATSLGFTLDTTAPVQTSVTAVADNGHTDIGIGHVVTITLDTGEAVEVTGTPELTLNDGGTASYAAGSGTTALTFDYTVASGDNTPDLHVTGYTGTIQDIAGNALTHASVAGDLGLQIDGVAPTGVLTFVTDSGETDLNAGHGHAVTFTLDTSQVVTVTGAPELQLSDGEFATYNSSASTATSLVFGYTVAAGDNSSDLHVAGTTNPNGGLVLNGGSILDAIGNPLAGNVSIDTGLIIDTTAPNVTGITALPGSGGVFTGSTVELTLDFNEDVALTGRPSLSLNDGATATYDPTATALLGDASKFVFDYLVSANDHTPSLAVTSFTGATIHDLAGNAADLNNVTAAFAALSINENIAPAYTMGGLTRPALELDQTGHIVLDQAAANFAALYGVKALYMGMPASTPYPPVVDSHSDFHIG